MNKNKLAILNELSISPWVPDSAFAFATQHRENEWKKEIFFFYEGKFRTQKILYTFFFALFFYYAIAIINIYIFSDFKKTPHSVITIWLTSFILFCIFWFDIFGGKCTNFSSTRFQCWNGNLLVQRQGPFFCYTQIDNTYK